MYHMRGDGRCRLCLTLTLPKVGEMWMILIGIVGAEFVDCRRKEVKRFVSNPAKEGDG